MIVKNQCYSNYSYIDYSKEKFINDIKSIIEKFWNNFMYSLSSLLKINFVNAFLKSNS